MNNKNLLLCKVAKIPTEKASNLWMTPLKKLRASGDYTYAAKDSGCINQYIYFTSSREIEKGGWYLFLKNNTICKADYDDDNLKIVNELRKSGHVSKIEATNDTSIQSAHLGHLLGQKENGVGTIPLSFIEAYVKGDIKDVNIEIVTKGAWAFERSSGYAGFRCQKCATWIYDNQKEECQCGLSVKLRGDNSVIIHRTKTYTRDEVKNLMLRFGIKIFEEIAKDNIGDFDQDKFIEENL